MPGPPRLPTNFGQSSGCGALRAGGESARRNAQDALFPALPTLRRNVLEPGCGGPDITERAAPPRAARDCGLSCPAGTPGDLREASPPPKSQRL